MAVTLDNRLRRMQVFNLVHDAYCRGGTCACSAITTVVVDENPRTGDRVPRRVQKKVPTALTLLAGEVRPGLPDGVLRVPDVRVALEKGDLRVVAQVADAAPARTPPAAAPAARRASTRRGKEA